MAEAQYAVALTAQDLTGPAFRALVDNAKKANQAIDELKKSTASSANVLDNLADRLKAGLQGFAALWTIDKAKEFAVQTVTAAKAITDLAKSTGLTTDQVQALQAIASKTGQSFDQLAEYFKNNRGELDRVTEAAKRTAQVMDRDMVAALTRIADESDDAWTKMKVWLVGGGGGENWIVDTLNAIARAIKNVGDSLQFMGRNQEAIEFIKTLLAGGFAGLGVRAGQMAAMAITPAGQTEDTRTQEQLTRARENLERAQQLFKDGAILQNDLDRSKADLEKAQTERDQFQSRLRSQIRQNDRMADDKDALKVTVTATKPPAGGGGGARTDDDLLEAQIKRYDALALSADRALETISKNTKENIEDLQREVKVQQQIDDIAGKLGAKYDQASQAQKDRLRASVTAAETERAAVEKRMQAETAAVETEKRMGDGTAFYAASMRDLQRQLETGRLSTGAYDLALKELGKSTEDLRLKNIGLAGGVEAFFAGWENAQNQFVRANNAFAQGGKLFDGIMGTMDQALSEFVQNGEINFQKLLGSFALMLAQMELRAAASSVWSAVGGAGGLGGIIGQIFGGGQSVPTIGGGTMDMGGAFAGIGGGTMGFAAGGNPPVGVPSLVGENGPELFVPRTAGTIIPNDQLGGGGGSVSVNIGPVMVGEFVTPSQLDKAMRVVHKAAMEGAQQALTLKRRRAVPSVKSAFA